MSIPKVAIVGRPNVGKSSLFNWLVGRRIAVVDATAGVTRDRVTHVVQLDDRLFELIDTGGMGIQDADRLDEQIERQITAAIEEADLLLFVVDAQTGLVPLDQFVADRLRSVNKPVVLVVNKCDSPKLEAELPQFFALLDAPAVAVSVRGRRNREGLIEAILAHLPKPADEQAAEDAGPAEEPELKLAIVGRRNVGKSTFINALSKTERMIVSEVPGTTRDSVDIRFELDGKVFVAIDTPGVRKRKSMAADYEFYGLTRALASIRRADVVLMLFDSQQTISRVDKQLVSEIAAHHKPCVFVVNKWDLALREGMTTEAWFNYLAETFATMPYVPVAFVTARTGRNVAKVIQLAQSIFKQARTRVATGPLNRAVRAAIEHNPPPYRRNKRPKIYYATQVGTTPPTIVLYCNDPALFDETWRRYLLGFLREALPFKEVPIRLLWRRRKRGEAEAWSGDDEQTAPESGTGEASSALGQPGSSPLPLEEAG